MDKLLHIKGSRTKVLSSLPTNSFGNDGDIVLSAIKGKGFYLCAKINGRWFVSNKLEDLKKMEKTSIRDLSVDRLKIKNTTLTKDELNNPTSNLTFNLKEGLTLRRISDDANAAELILQKERSDTTIDDNDYVGKILFKAYDDQGTPEIMTAGQISTQVLDASSNNELAKMAFSVLTDEFSDADVPSNFLSATGIGSGYGNVQVNLGSGTGTDNFIHGHTKFTASNHGGEATNGKIHVIPYAAGASPYILIESLADNGDYLKLQTDASGASTISTTDDGGANAHLTLRPDGKILMEMANQDGEDDGWAVINNAHNMMTFKTEGGAENLFTIYEAGSPGVDKFQIEVQQNGVTKITTYDAAGADAHLKFEPDGSFLIKETASAGADAAGYGQLWIKNDTPNNLYFTDDTGQDVAITNNGSLNAPKAKTYLDWYYYFASLSSNDTFYVSLHHDEFGVTSSLNTNIDDYDDTTAEDMWRVLRYAGKRIPYTGDVTKFMVSVESTGASADSDVEVGVWVANKPVLDSQLSSTTNMTIDNLGYITFDFSAASRFLHKELTSFNATSVNQGDFMFITVKKTVGTDGTYFNIHSTVTMDID